MKKLFLLVLVMSFSTVLYCQSDSSKLISVKNQIDSIIIKYNIKTIEVTSTNNINVGPSADFKIQNDFLIVSKSYYFNLNKIVSISVGQKIINNNYYLSIVFN
jgi:hypothetical protein